MFDLLFSSRIDLHIISLLEDTFVIIMIYSFIKMLLLSSLVELIWPTQFFNRRHSVVSGLQIRQRTFTEYLSKIRASNTPLFKVLLAVNIL